MSDRKRRNRSERRSSSASRERADRGGDTAANRREIPYGLLIFLLALIVRLVYLAESSDNPTFALPLLDMADYDDLARDTIAGQPSHTPLFWQPVFYPFFLTTVYFITGKSMIAAKLLQAVLGSVTCWLTYRLGRRVLDRRTGLLAGLITCLYGPMIFFEGELLATGWATFWTVAMVLLLLHVSRSKKLGIALLLGACAALSVITRPTFLPALLACGVWLIIAWYREQRSFERVPLRLLFVAIGLALVAIPVACLNLHLTGHFGIMPSSGGINAYIGNNPAAPETISYRPGQDWNAMAELPAEHGVTGGPWEKQRFFYDLVRDYAADDPGGFASGLGRKAIELVSSREIPRSVDVYAFRQWSAILTGLVWKIGGFGFPFGVLLPLAVVGLIHCARRTPAPMWLLPLLYGLSIVLIFVAARYRTPLIPLVAIFAAAGCFALRDVIRERSRGRSILYGVVLVAVIALGTLPGPYREEQHDYAAELHLLLGHRHLLANRMTDAAEQYRRGLALSPDDAELHSNLAEALLRDHRPDEAIPHYDAALRRRADSAVDLAGLGLSRLQMGQAQQAVELCRRALEIDPTAGDVWSNLGVALQKLGRLDEAIDAFNEALRLSPEEINTRYNLAAAYFTRNDFDAAIREFERLLKTDPNHILAHYGLARALYNQGRQAEAVVHLQAINKLDPAFTPARELLNTIQSGAMRR